MWLTTTFGHVWRHVSVSTLMTILIGAFGSMQTNLLGAFKLEGNRRAPNRRPPSERSCSSGPASFRCPLGGNASSSFSSSASSLT
eukprot:6798410-Prymnesium_polylepis.1